MAARGEAESPGYSREKISFALVLSADGEPIDRIDFRQVNGKRLVPALKEVPAAVRRTMAISPNLFWDKTAYALGRTGAEDARTLQEHNAFRTLHLEVLAGANDAGLAALRRFLERWMPERFDAPPFIPEMLDTNVVFRLDGDAGFIHEREAARRIVEARSAGDAEQAMCLITGAVAPVRRLHPSIRGVEGAQSSGASLVSFNLEAFKSYGKEQGDNAPTSEAAAFRYGAALNRMLDRGSRDRIQRTVGDTTVVFWADASGVGETAANAAEDVFATIFDPPSTKPASDSDAQEAVKLRDRLEDFAKGRPVKHIDPRLEPGTRFYVLGLAPNAARLSVRFWLEDRFEHVAHRLGLHARDLAIEPQPGGWVRPPSVQRLLVKTTALQEKFDNIPPQLGGEVTRAVLTGLPYPRTLLSAAIMRLRAGDDPRSGWRAAAIKACINRALRFRFGEGARPDGSRTLERSNEEEIPVALEPQSKNAAYQLGRLFAVLEAAQYAALGRVNAPIGDRYSAAASATPARVFGPLLRGLKHHVSDAKKRGKGGWIEPKVGEIMLMLPPDLPRTLHLEDQGRFAVGYYHERATRPATSNDTETEGKNNDE
ncbi:MAG TPA: type I-C CRISPR-associated protein Cas8c/Csd1 [Roseiarcus sp.]|nr:type I-C CRISPR-associated protein Cas8c/Csd1 [Roseiarcus sp.]